MRGLTVRQLAAFYHVIGKLVTGDSGDYHLMLGVGGKVACLIPPNNPQMGYLHWDLLYSPVCWGGEKARVRYCMHEDWVTLMDTRLFDSFG